MRLRFSPLLVLALVACAPEDADDAGGTSDGKTVTAAETPASEPPEDRSGSSSSSGAREPAQPGAKLTVVPLEKLVAREEHDAEKVTVSHILIAFDGAPLIPATRTKEEAEALADELLERIAAGEDFEALRKEHTDDPGPATYTMTAEAPTESNERARTGMVPGFGDVGWRLQVGEVGLAPHDAAKSPYGWHIIQRVETPRIEPIEVTSVVPHDELVAREEHDAKRIEVSHILVSFDGAPRIQTTRTKEEAEALANRLLEQIENGEDFDSLRKAHSDDPGPRTYGMYVGSSGEPDDIARSGMVPAFGDVGWRLQVGEVGLAPHDPTKSPYGWHIVVRTK